MVSTYGYKFDRKNSWLYKEGVYFASHINKWIVRVKTRNNYTTLAQFKTKEEAEKCFEEKHWKEIDGMVRMY